MHIPSHTLKCSNTQISASESLLFPDPFLRNDKNLLVVVTLTGNSILIIFMQKNICIHINMFVCMYRYLYKQIWDIYVHIAIKRGTLQLLSINPRPRTELYRLGKIRWWRQVPPDLASRQVVAGREQGSVYYQPKQGTIIREISQYYSTFALFDPRNTK